MKNVLIVFMVLFVAITQAQVGINTSSAPTAHLEIESRPNGIPTLKLEPQSSPAGSATGQMAVIDDMLFMYDADRNKWLSVEVTLLSFGLLDKADNQSLEFIGDVEKSGPLMPFDGTIVSVAMNASGGQVDKQVQLFKNNVAVPANLDTKISGLVTMDGHSFVENDYNLDFNAGDWFRISVTDLGEAVENISIVLKIKWRK